MALFLAAQPRIHEMPPATMAVVRTAGDPGVVAQPAIAALFAAATALGGPRGALRARWPDAGHAPREHWTGIWALPIAPGATAVPQVVPTCHVDIETWAYGTVAEILHEGPYATESASIQVLHDHIAARGYQVVGPHEEEYLTMPNVPLPRTVIRYPVARLAGI